MPQHAVLVPLGCTLLSATNILLSNVALDRGFNIEPDTAFEIMDRCRAAYVAA
jgi:hypothetical protein